MNRGVGLNLDNMNSQKIILAPRSFPILVIQIFGLCPLLIVMIMVLAIVTSDASFTPKDLMYLTAIIGPLLTVSILMLYFPQKYIPRLKIDQAQNIFEKVKKGQALHKYEFDSIKGFTSKRILTIPGGKFKLLLDKIDGSSVEIFNEDTPYKGSNWERFAEKLSALINKPLINEIWAEDYNGTLSLISPEAIKTNRKKGASILAVPLCIAFFGAVYFKMFPSSKAFILAGSVTVILNISISYYYIFKNREDFEKWSNNTFVLIVSTLTLIIPYSIFYIFLASLLNGFQLPIKL